MNRRAFLASSAAGVAALCGAEGVSPTPPKRRCGFNFLNKFGWGRNEPFREEDFALLAEWGFNFARLPLSYKNWTVGDGWKEFHEPTLKELDDAVALGKKYGVHICMNFHRAPGYCVGEPKEPFDLWKDAEALEACVYHWAHFAKRYKGVPGAALSFDLVNEPAKVPREDYARVVKALVEAIRAEDPAREISADGLMYGRVPVPELVPLGIGQNAHAYDPMPVTHYGAGWVAESKFWKAPSWPPDPANPAEGKQRLYNLVVKPWKELESLGVPIHVGEFGVFNKTPHAVALAWIQDQLDLWKAAGWGWALWEFDGTFGVLNSGREDVAYEDFRGRKLDRKMLELLRAGL